MEQAHANNYKLIEEITLNAWPCRQQILFDGWILRFADGYTRRANSINAIYPGSLNVVEKIRRCEKIYRKRQLRPVFKITPFVQPTDLDTLLDQMGFERHAPTSVQLLDLGNIQTQTTASVTEWATPSEEWIAAYVQMNNVAIANIETLRAILNNIAPATCFLSVANQDENVAACGLAVRDGDYVGLFDIVTDPAQRQMGFGTRLVANLLQWAKKHGAKKAYLQVMLNNKTALNLYAKLGFREIYQYWYRVLPGPTA